MKRTKVCLFLLLILLGLVIAGCQKQESTTSAGKECDRKTLTTD